MPTARATRARRQSPPVKESEATPSENGIAAAGAKRDRDRDDARDEDSRNDANDAPTTTASPEPRSKRAKGTAVESSEKAVDDDFKTLVRIDGNAGRVIGKGGEHVKYIETECSVRLEFRRDEGVAVVRPLASTESGEPTTSERRRADARRAKALIEEAASTGQIMELLTKGVPSDVNEGIRLDPSVIPDDIMRGDDDEDVEAEIPCPGKEGRVIGRGAATIREISARSGASCHVIKGSGVCVAKGKRKRVRMAYQMVHDTLQLSVDRFGAPPQTHSASFHAAPPRVQGLPHGAMVLPNGMAMVPPRPWAFRPRHPAPPVWTPPSRFRARATRGESSVRVARRSNFCARRRDVWWILSIKKACGGRRRLRHARECGDVQGVRVPSDGQWRPSRVEEFRTSHRAGGGAVRRASATVSALCGSTAAVSPTAVPAATVPAASVPAPAARASAAVGGMGALLRRFGQAVRAQSRDQRDALGVKE